MTLLVIALLLTIIPWAIWRINQHNLVVNTSSDVGAVTASGTGGGGVR